MAFSWNLMVIYLSSLLLLFTIFWMGIWWLFSYFYYFLLFFYIQKPHPLHIIKDYYFLLWILWVSFTVSTVPLYALRPLRSFTYSINEWPVNDEDERLDQDMRKDDEEPRAAREWGSRSISPVNRSSPALFGSSHTRLLSLASCAPLRPSRMSVAKEVRRRGHRKEEKGKEWRAGWQGC